MSISVRPEADKDPQGIRRINLAAFESDAEANLVNALRERRGIGSRLVEAGLEACREQGHKIVVVLGHPDFYPRFGFSANLARPLENPFDSGVAWMAMGLVPEALAGVKGRVEYPSPFMMFE